MWNCRWSVIDNVNKYENWVPNSAKTSVIRIGKINAQRFETSSQDVIVEHSIIHNRINCKLDLIILYKEIIYVWEVYCLTLMYLVKMFR